MSSSVLAATGQASPTGPGLILIFILVIVSIIGLMLLFFVLWALLGAKGGRPKQHRRDPAAESAEDAWDTAARRLEPDPPPSEKSDST